MYYLVVSLLANADFDTVTTELLPLHQVSALPGCACCRRSVQDAVSHGCNRRSKTDVDIVVRKLLHCHGRRFLGPLILKDVTNTDSDSDSTL